MTPPLYRSFLRDRRANVAMMFGFLVIPIVLTVGMGVDYGAASRLSSKLHAAADAASLAAVTPQVMTQSDAASVLAATNMFNAEIIGQSRLIYDPANLKVTVTDVGLARSVVVSYSAQSQNVFGSILKMPTIAFSGSSTASAATPPNIDFYLLLDTSPSMGIAGTPADIAKMVAATSAQGGCAFACHEVNPGPDNLGNPGGEDNYALARNLNVTLRTDLLDAAISDLTNTAYATQTNASTPVKPAYRMSINSFDVTFQQIVPLTSNYVATWATQLAAIKSNNTQFLEVYDNNNICSPTTTTSHGVTTTNPCGTGLSNSDADTNYDTAMAGITALMPTPGMGTNQVGDKPQEIMFLMTDGVEDESISGGRQQSTMTGTKDWCTPLKTKGIKIAVLYTTYFPLPTNSWYNTYISPIQTSIGPTLQNCASSGLYYEVGLGQDISAALSQLFQSAVSSARLTQ
jgi:Flp pilus assembly protein TadG